jgi:hypothetical protein
MDRGAPGVRAINLRFSRVRIIWWIDGAETPKYFWRSASAGGRPWILV